jgi:hypothetical protein
MQVNKMTLKTIKTKSILSMPFMAALILSLILTACSPGVPEEEYREPEQDNPVSTDAEPHDAGQPLESKAAGWLESELAAEDCVLHVYKDGVSTGFFVSGTDIPWEYGKRRHAGATAWLAFAQLGANPFVSPPE